jgi:hypothetical protein
LQQGISISDDTLYINGTSNPNHIVIKPGEAPGVVEVVFDGKPLGSFGPAAQIVVQGGSGSDVMIVEPDVTLPVVLHGGAGDSCLQAGSGPDQLFGGPGNDVLIAGTGRPALDAGPGVNRVVVPQSMGELWVAPSAKGGFLRQIGTLYTLQPLPQSTGEPSQELPSPIILGPADLADASIIPLLKETYAAGQAIALVSATADDAQRLRTLLGHPNAAEGLAEGEIADLIFFRKAPRPGTSAPDYRAGIFGHPPNAATQSPARKLGEYTIELVSRVFSAIAIVPQAPSDSPSNDLLKLANSYTSSRVNQDSNGNAIQMVNSVWAVRSFQNQADFYYVQQEADYQFAPYQPEYTWWNWAQTVLVDVANDPKLMALIQTSPASTHCAVSTTSSLSWNIDGSAGWNQTQGVNAAATGGVSVSKSQTIHCPSVQIKNLSDFSSLQLWWQYVRDEPPGSTLFTSHNQWIWEVKFLDYQPGQQVVALATTGGSSFQHKDCQPFQSCYTFYDQLVSAVPLPFGDTFVLQQPTVLSVNPTCALAGSTFTIYGTGMYPSLVTGVVIGGTPLTTSQYSIASDTLLQVTAPDQPSEFLQPVVVQTALGLSNSNVTIEIPYLFCD